MSFWLRWLLAVLYNPWIETAVVLQLQWWNRLAKAIRKYDSHFIADLIHLIARLRHRCLPHTIDHLLFPLPLRLGRARASVVTFTAPQKLVAAFLRLAPLICEIWFATFITTNSSVLNYSFQRLSNDCNSTKSRLCNIVYFGWFTIDGWKSLKTLIRFAFLWVGRHLANCTQTLLFYGSYFIGR